MKYLSQYRGLRNEIYILFLGKIVIALGAFVYPLFSLMMKSKLNFSVSQIAFVFSLSALLGLPATLIGGKLADQWGRKNMIVTFDMLSVSLFFIAGLLPISEVTIYLLLGSGLFSVMTNPAYSALVSDYSEPINREKAFSLTYLGYNLGFIIGPTLGGLLFQDYFNVAIILNGVAMLISTLLIVFFVNDEESFRNQRDFTKYEKHNSYENAQNEETIWTIVKQRKAVIIVILAGSIGGIVYGVSSFILPLAIENYYGSQGAVYIGLLSSFNGFVVILFTPVLTVLLQSWKEIPKMMVGVTLFLGGIAFYGFSMEIVLLFSGMYVFTIGEVINALGSNPYITRRIPMSHRGRIFSVSSIIGTLVTIAGQQGSGWLLDHYSYPIVWVSLIGVGVVAIVVFSLTMKMDRKQFPKLYQGE